MGQTMSGCDDSAMSILARGRIRLTRSFHGEPSQHCRLGSYATQFLEKICRGQRDAGIRGT